MAGGSSPHSELHSTALAGIQDGYNEGEDEFDCSPEARCGSCVGCEAEAALNSLIEQLEAMREALEEIDRYAMRSEGGSVVGAGRLARAALASYPATRPDDQT